MLRQLFQPFNVSTFLKIIGKTCWSPQPLDFFAPTQFFQFTVDTEDISRYHTCKIDTIKSSTYSLSRCSVISLSRSCCQSFHCMTCCSDIVSPMSEKERMKGCRLTDRTRETRSMRSWTNFLRSSLLVFMYKATNRAISTRWNKCLRLSDVVDRCTLKIKNPGLSSVGTLFIK